MRDLFSTDEDGWLQDPALVELLVSEKLSEVAQEIAGEGWKWVEAAIDLPFGCERGKRRITGTTVPLTDEEQSRRDSLVDEYDRNGEEYRDGSDLPDEVDARLTEIDAELTELNCRQLVYDPLEQARAGVFVSLAHDRRLRIDRGYVRPEDEPVGEGDVAQVTGDGAGATSAPSGTVGGQVQHEQPAEDEDDVIRPLPDRLDVDLVPSRIVMNPPFSTALHVETCVADAALRHLSSALARLGGGGRLVAITGANCAPDHKAWRDGFVRLQESARVVLTATIAGSVFAPHGTAVETRLTVIVKVPADDQTQFPASRGSAPDLATLLRWLIARRSPSDGTLCRPCRWQLRPRRPISLPSC